MTGAGQGGRSSRTGRSSSRAAALPGSPQRRCAVYTRKSSEEGLEQEYNSLHAQREACEAYIRSQQHEGWRLLPAAYDDGGLSGGTMQRPALQSLLAEIRAGRIDTIVVYKVDRLTRSLADFAKMVDVFDAHGVSFVAVTQQFNTTTSMGRLTLNILLSFAQFEREVTGERIRDKIAASKRRGMWMGGRTPLGYAVENHKLVVVPEDAATVVQLYRRYLELGSVRELKAALDAEGTVSKARTLLSGSEVGGTPYSRGALYALLSNPVYLGQVRHKEAVYPGQHEAIVSAALHASVQAKLAESNNGGPGAKRARVEPSLLAGKLFDQAGERLVPSHARKGERRYRYYVSADLLRPAASRAAHAVSSTAAEASATNTEATSSLSSETSGWRLPAREIEQVVWAAAISILHHPSTLVPDMLEAGVPPDRIEGSIKQLESLAAQLEAGADNSFDRQRLATMIRRVDLSPAGMMLTIETGISAGAENTSDASFTVCRFVPHRVQRRGVEMRLVIAAPGAPARDDAALLKAVARAHCWFEYLVEGRAASVQALAERLDMTTRYVQRLLPLALLSPHLVEQIAAGQHPATLTVDRLIDRGPMPIRWAEQVDHLGD